MGEIQEKRSGDGQGLRGRQMEMKPEKGSLVEKRDRDWPWSPACLAETSRQSGSDQTKLTMTTP